MQNTQPEEQATFISIKIFCLEKKQEETTNTAHLRR